MGFSVSWKTLLGAILTPWPWGFPTQWGTRGIPHRLADYFIFPPALSPLSPAQVVNTSTMAGESWGVDTCLGCKVPRCPLGWGLASHTYHSPWLASQQGFSGPSPGTAGQGMGDRHIPQRGQSAVPLQSICQCLGPLGSNGVTAEASGGNPVLRAAGATEVKLTFMSVLGKNLLGFRTSCLVKLGQRDYLRGQGRRSPRWPHVIWRRKQICWTGGLRPSIEEGHHRQVWADAPRGHPTSRGGAVTVGSAVLPTHPGECGLGGLPGHLTSSPCPSGERLAFGVALTPEPSDLC